jgi:hypothetical protein
MDLHINSLTLSMERSSRVVTKKEIPGIRDSDRFQLLMRSAGLTLVDSISVL